MDEEGEGMITKRQRLESATNYMSFWRADATSPKYTTL